MDYTNFVVASSSEWSSRCFIGYSWDADVMGSQEGIYFIMMDPREARLTKSVILITTDHDTTLLVPCGKLGKEEKKEQYS